jgi:TolB-like protein
MTPAQAPKNGTIDSIAVLPLANVSGDPRMEYLPDGITESLIDSQSRLTELRVIARSAVFTYKGREFDPRQVGAALNVRAVVTGRVSRQGEQLIIRAELVDVSDGARLWGEEYQRPVADILALQDEIARRISAKLRLRLDGDGQREMARRYTADAEAYHLLHLSITPYFDSLRSEPRFIELARRVGLPQ